MYGTPQAAKISHDSLVQQLEPYGYLPSRITPVLWKQYSLPINFTLLVYDFGGKYSGNKHALHLKTGLEDKYKVSNTGKENFTLV